MLVLNLTLIGLAITLEPIPFTAFALILSSTRGIHNAVMFLAGWILSLAAVIALTLAATGNNPPKPSTAPSETKFRSEVRISARRGEEEARMRFIGYLQ